MDKRKPKPTRKRKPRKPKPNPKKRKPRKRKPRPVRKRNVPPPLLLSSGLPLGVQRIRQKSLIPRAARTLIPVIGRSSRQRDIQREPVQAPFLSIFKNDPFLTQGAGLGGKRISAGPRKRGGAVNKRKTIGGAVKKRKTRKDKGKKRKPRKK